MEVGPLYAPHDAAVLVPSGTHAPPTVCARFPTAPPCAEEVQKGPTKQQARFLARGLVRHIDEATPWKSSETRLSQRRRTRLGFDIAGWWLYLACAGLIVVTGMIYLASMIAKVTL